MAGLLAGCSPIDPVAVEDAAVVASDARAPETDSATPSTAHRDPWHGRLATAGIVERTFRIGDVTLEYAEGPDNGPPLLLLHAQHMDWYSYSRVLPQLSTSFHVFAVSYHGHGMTESPTERLDAAHIGADLATFIDEVIGEPVFLTGNSSGALLSLWLAANEPERVRSVLLEDPPLFTSELPRSRETIAFRTFTTCHDFLAQSETDDFLLYWLDSNRAFVVSRFGEAGFTLLRDEIVEYRIEHPGERIEINYLPDTVRLLIRGLDVYDPQFGDGFYDGSWSEGFDQAEALGRVEAPTLLLHARFEYLDDGTLNGALDDDDAARAMSLLANGRYLEIDAEHVVHLDQPGRFIEILREHFVVP